MLLHSMGHARYVTMLFLAMLALGVQLLLPGSCTAAEGSDADCSSWFFTLNHQWDASASFLEGAGWDFSAFQAHPGLYTRHLCFCTDPGSEQGDCFYDSAQSSDPNPPSHADEGCGWDDREPGPMNCGCTQPTSSCCGDAINP